MFLNILWFVLIAVLYTGFFLLEGFDYGVGILLPFLSKDRDAQAVDRKRRIMLNTIGPHWDGNEVWLLTAGGATFAAFPGWYATLFSGFYLALFLLLLALIVRGVAFEFRSKDDHPRWRSICDWAIFTGSLLPALLMGVAFANLIHGVPIDADMNYAGTFFNLLNPYALLGGLVSVLGFTLYGALYLSLKTTGQLAERAKILAQRVWLPVVVILIGALIATYFATDILDRPGVIPGIVPFTSLLALLATGYFIRKRMNGWAFLLNAMTIVLTVATVFMILFPRVMVSSLGRANDLTIYNTASSPYTLTVMAIVAAIFIPLVLLYQVWSYRLFRKKLTADDPLEY